MNKKDTATGKEWSSLINDLIDSLTISQSELAQMCNVSQQAVSKWTKGLTKPSKFAQRQISQLLCTKTDQVSPMNSSIEELIKNSYSYNSHNNTRTQYIKEFAEISKALSLKELKEVIEYAKYRNSTRSVKQTQI